MTLGEEHVPETELPGLDLEVLDNLRVVLPAGIALTNLGFENGVGSVGERGGQRIGTAEEDWGRIGCSRNAFLLYKLGHNVERLLGSIADAIRGL